jgi:hypothetical protein
MHVLGLEVLDESLCERLLLMDTVLLISCLKKLYFYEMRNEYKILVGQSGRKSHLHDIGICGKVLL